MTNSNSDLQLQRRALGNRRRRTPSLSKSLRLMLAFAFTVQFISPAWQMRMLHLNDGRSPSSSSTSTSSRLLLRSRRAIPTPKIYDDVRDVPRMTSTGPIEANDGIGGLYHFTDVCLTKHHLLNENLQGVIYFQPDNDELLANELRCVPCSAPLNHGGGWDGEGRDEKAVRHKCGFTTAHAMLDRWGQHQIPSRAEVVHWYEEPIISLNFRPNIGHALFDYMLAYLPHWYAFRTNNNMPFAGVISHVFQGCLSDSHDWFCTILRAMEAFGNAQELPREPNNTTLYCYKSLYLVHVAYQRTISHEGLLTESVFVAFRDIMFTSFKLKRARDYHLIRTTEANGNAAASSIKEPTKLLFYAHEPSGRRVWNGMHDLIDKFKDEPKYKAVEFNTVYDFGVFSTAEQAALFNEADAHIMTHGAQMANSIFAVDDTVYIELGCSIPTYLANPKFLSLIKAQYQSVVKCGDGNDDICLQCDGNDDTYGNFTMTESSFVLMLDKALHTLEQNESKRKESI
ncbi:predicted protein [Thalassiosira pseudonana CCMP1335]|uniref:Glycosyltransferase 61 catalytic domain-containing protein n=1 Tax=Thalassiosira pseudonana TaxID=35128 RepID=B8CE11_THAPS|nr:predicted protein [Thalassiosira pseudonana CCMP1335]EED88188.1 predicted protein [Thalassiosira pseudonana CCMP1335]